jgi:hypothetical protein
LDYPVHFDPIVRQEFKKELTKVLEALQNHQHVVIQTKLLLESYFEDSVLRDATFADQKNALPDVHQYLQKTTEEFLSQLETRRKFLVQALTIEDHFTQNETLLLEMPHEYPAMRDVLVSIQTVDWMEWRKWPSGNLTVQIRTSDNNLISEGTCFLYRGRGSIRLHLKVNTETPCVVWVRASSEDGRLFGNGHIVVYKEQKYFDRKVANITKDKVKEKTIQAWGPHEDVYIIEDIELVELRIRESTNIFIDSGVSANVTGLLKVEGTQSQPVTFTSNTNNPWGQIKIKANANATLEYTWLSGGGVCSNAIRWCTQGHSNARPVIEVIGGQLKMFGGGFVDNTGRALGTYNAIINMHATLVSRCDVGAQFDLSLLHLDKTYWLEIPDNDRRAEDDDNDGMYLRGAHSSGNYSVIKDSVIAVTEDDGIDHNGALVNVRYHHQLFC